MANTRKSSGRTAPAPTVPASALDAPIAEELPVAGAAAQRPVSVLQLGSSLSIREVTHYATQLKQMLAAGPTDIDAGKLESIDTAGVQLLLLAAAAAQRRGYTMKLRGAHGIRAGAARALGLHEHLGELAEFVA